MATQSLVMALKDANREKQKIIDLLMDDIVILNKQVDVLNAMLDAHEDINTHFNGGYEFR